MERASMREPQRVQTAADVRQLLAAEIADVTAHPVLNVSKKGGNCDRQSRKSRWVARSGCTPEVT